MRKNVHVLRVWAVRLSECALSILSCCVNSPISQLFSSMHTIQSSNDIIEVYLHGKINQYSLLNAQNELLCHPDFHFKNSLWLLDESFECEFSYPNTLEMIQLFKRLHPSITAQRNVALFAESGMNSSMVQWYLQEAENAGLFLKFRPFLSYADAIAWLTEC